MNRVLVKDASLHEGKEVMLSGRVLFRRELGNVTFLVIQDYTGQIQTVWDGNVDAKVGEVISCVGALTKEDRAKGGYELHGKELIMLSRNKEDLPFDISSPKLNLQLTTLLDNRTLSLRHPRTQAIFKLYDLLLEGYGKAMRQNGFTEIKTPKLLGAASEGGANFFKLGYFDTHAYLAQSPQLYKQIMVGVFERVFEIGSVFRAEPHFTTRHVNEYIGLDAEFGFIENFTDVTAMLNKIVREVFLHVKEKGSEYAEMYDVRVPEVPEKIPHIKLSEIKKIIKEKYGYDVPAETDIDPEGERMAGRYAKEEFGSDFIFLTHYPWRDRPFYTMPDKENPEETCSYDLLMNGMEIVTGSQRIHNYDQLIENMEKKGVKPDGLEFYLDTFKFAMPPHGGWGMGSERLIQQMLGLKSIKEAVLFPRDVKRLAP